jgi:hypothetical protein
MLPELYRPIAPAFLDEPAPREDKATCSSCAMCRPDGVPATTDVVHFRPDAKCCTYHPKLPNYLIGGVLADEHADMDGGKRRLRAKIAARVGVTPMWIAPPRKTSILLRASWASSFGRSLVLRCPYFEEAGGGLCSIWRYREADCSSFFCKYSAGADGQAFWRSYNAYLRHIESCLSEHVTRAIAPHLTEPRLARGELTVEDLEDRAPDPAAYASYWREWEGREEEFYIACYRRAAAVTRDELAQILGEEGRNRLAAMEDAHRRVMSPALPERLMLSPEIAAQAVPGGVLVATYSRYEPLLLSADLYEALKEFRGDETVAQVYERLAREAGVSVPEAMLLALHQLRVVVAKEPARSGG